MQWHVQELFEQVIELPPDQREAYLEGIDPSIRAEVKRLVEAEQATPGLTPSASILPQLRNSGPRAFFDGEMISHRFRIVCFLGRGGMGEVYEAEDQVLREFVALKTVRSEIVSGRHVFERFKQEIKLAKQVTSENVCRIYDLDHNNVPPFVTMELIRGKTLAERLRSNGRMTTSEALPLVEQIANGLATVCPSGPRARAAGNRVPEPSLHRQSQEFRLSYCSPLSSTICLFRKPC